MNVRIVFGTGTVFKLPNTTFLYCHKQRCGEWFELYLGYGKVLSCRLELGRDWYIITGQHEVRFYLKQNETYQVNL
ncbi:hypothetical protein CF394_07015 [Tetzosporium hominis]|uniref:DUF5348 domain-containing protein n=1 Tax=Tetzosporium hominis TaxID=2020506 RepID=A0A264W4J6_9BACL|nr:DUF5348 domain-containing protein [Tetzosporium hominis]OZS78500.1 hypothetical protein CF394_07015 [Tetzosporium hominis]